MKNFGVLLLLLVLALSQNASKCDVCQKVPKCPKELFEDATVDPIFNFIAK